MAARTRGKRARGAGAVLLTLVLLGAAACGAPAPETEPDAGPELAGCWELEVTAQGGALDSIRTWLSAGTLPRLLQLDTAAVSVDEPQGARVAYSWFHGRRETDPFSEWERFRDDSVRVQRTGALAGLMLRLAPSDGALSGHVVSFTDVTGLGQEARRRQAPVTARPVPCPEPSPVGGDP